MFHSDLGTQYMSYIFVRLLEDFGVKQSFSRTARPRDNAVAEAFFSILKGGRIIRYHYTSEADLMRGIHRFIDFYNLNAHILQCSIKLRSRRNRNTEIKRNNPHLYENSGFRIGPFYFWIVILLVLLLVSHSDKERKS